MQFIKNSMCVLNQFFILFVIVGVLRKDAFTGKICVHHQTVH
jgi:hypothetical protein